MTGSLVKEDLVFNLQQLLIEICSIALNLSAIATDFFIRFVKSFLKKLPASSRNGMFKISFVIEKLFDDFACNF